MKLDLHCHTRLSDGSATPEELVRLVREIGLDGVAVTDHDTLQGAAQALEAGRRLGIRVAPGVEISAQDRSRGRRVHILCYFPRRTGELNAFLQKILDSRRDAMLLSIEKVRKLYPVPKEMILSRAAGSASIYKQHVMQALMDAGYTDQMFGDVFRRLFSPKEGAAYVKIDYPDVGEALSQVQRAEGAAVLAHPSEYDSMDLLQELCEKGLLQGAEAYHPRNKPEDTETIRQLCARYGLAVTGGTDYHGCYTRICNPPGTYLTDGAEFDRVRKALK